MGEVSPLLLVTLRWVGAVLLLGVFARRSIVREWPLVRPHLLMLFAMGTLGFTIFNSLMYLSAYTTTALNIGIIQGAIPIYILLGALVIYRTPVSGLQWTGVAVTVLGVCIVASHGELSRLAALAITQGDYYMVVACLLYAGYALSLRRFRAIPALALFAAVALAAMLSSLPLSFYEYTQGELIWPTAKGWVIVVLVTLLPSFIAQICFIQGVTDIGPGRAGIFVNLVPVFASLLAVLVLGESFQLFHGLALALVVGGIWLAERRAAV